MLTCITLGIAPILGAYACSGKTLHEVGDLNAQKPGGAAGAYVGNAGAWDGGSGGSDIDRPDASAGNAGRSDGGNGGAGGDLIVPNAGASGETVIANAGDGGNGDGADLDCPTCSAITDNQDVRAVVPVGDDVYWLEYGEFDRLGNYSYDGRLWGRNVSSGEQKLIASGLPGPEQLSVNGDFAYVLVSQRTQPKLPHGLLRIPLAGGTPEEVSTSDETDIAGPPGLAVLTGYEYWVFKYGIARVTNVANTAKEVVLPPRYVRQVTSDGTTLFFKDSQGIWSMESADIAPVQLTDDPDNNIGLVAAGAYLYALLNSSKHSLIRMPKTGGPWKVLATYEPSISWLAIDGDRLFIGGYGDTTFNLYQAQLSAPGSKSRLLSYNASELWPWAISEAGLFYGNNHGLYFTPGAP